jgi:hypothetical protein
VQACPSSKLGKTQLPCANRWVRHRRQLLLPNAAAQCCCPFLAPLGSSLGPIQLE